MVLDEGAEGSGHVRVWGFQVCRLRVFHGV